MLSWVLTSFWTLEAHVFVFDNLYSLYYPMIVHLSLVYFSWKLFGMYSIIWLWDVPEAAHQISHCIFASSVHFLCVSPARFVNIILLIGILIGAQRSPYYVRVSALLSLSSFRFFHLPTIKSLCDLLREDTSRLFYSLISACAGRETYY